MVTPWTPQEVGKIIAYARKNLQELVSNMIANIVTGFVRFRKPRWFFKTMAAIVGRPSTLCKSKFQNNEHEIYVKHLEVPEDYYLLFCRIRKNKSSQVTFDFQNFQPHFFQKQMHFANFFDLFLEEQKKVLINKKPKIRIKSQNYYFDDFNKKRLQIISEIKKKISYYWKNIKVRNLLVYFNHR